MTAKEYLMQIRILDARCRSLESEIEAIRAETATLRSPWPDGQPHGTNVGDPVGTQASKLADQLNRLEEQLLKNKGRLWLKRMEIVETIGRVQDADCNRLLYMRYIENRKWEEIAVELGYTYRWVTSIHGNALKKIDEIRNSSY